MLSGCTIVTSQELATLRKLKKIWWIGWGVALVCGILLIYSWARMQKAEELLNKMPELESRLEDLQDTQTKINDKFIEAWHNQERTADSLLIMGSYFKDRKDISNLNNGMANNGKFK